MSFQNEQVDIATLPKLDDLVLTPISAKHAVILFVLHSALSLTLLLILLFVAFQPWLSMDWLVGIGSGLRSIFAWLLPILATLLGALITYRYKANRLKAFALRQHDMNFRKGLFWRTLVTQPLLRVQHIEIERGPIERKVGLATLALYSAGGDAYSLSIPGLSLALAEEMRQYVLDYKENNQQSAPAMRNLNDTKPVALDLDSPEAG